MSGNLVYPAGSYLFHNIRNAHLHEWGSLVTDNYFSIATAGWLHSTIHWVRVMFLHFMVMQDY